MNRQISFFYEPNRVKMIWQSGGHNRKKYVIGELVRSVESVSLSYFWMSSDFNEALMYGFQGHPAFNIDEPVHHYNVMEIFSKRLPPRHRNDFRMYLSHHRLELYPHISNFALLGYTGAYLPGDGFSFAVDFWYQRPPLEFLMEVSGFRYYDGMQMDLMRLQGSPVQFIHEPENQTDPYAVKIEVDGVCIGYVPRFYSQNVLFWKSYLEVYAHVERIDGAFVKPQVHVMVTIYGKQPQVDHQ